MTFDGVEFKIAQTEGFELGDLKKNLQTVNIFNFKFYNQPKSF